MQNEIWENLNGAWSCECGNNEMAEGFFPSDHEGNEIEPIKGKWDGLMLCGRCQAMTNQEEVKRSKFLCYWGDGYVHTNSPSIQDSAFFTEDRGYTLDMLIQIERLKFQEMLIILEDGQHIIVRIK